MKSLDRFDVNVKDKELMHLMEEIFEGTDIVCQYEEDVILLVKREALLQQKNQQVRIKGKVVDKKGEPLPGTTILIQETTVGTASDQEGRFSLTLPNDKNVIVEFRFVGMETKVIRLADLRDEEVLLGQRDLVVTLVESSQSLDDVVVTGFANVRKETYTGDAVRIKGEDIVKVANRNLISALEVFDPSFSIQVNNAMGSNPNYIPDFSIRGQSSIGQRELDVADVSESRLRSNVNTPLFIVDGLDASVEYVYDLDPQRIFSVTILKDAAATAVYGSRASNGVIVIETIAPKAGKFNISYSLAGSVTTPDLTSYDYFNAQEKLDVEKLTGYYEIDPQVYSQGVRNVYSELIQKSNAIAKGVNTYWLSQPLRTGYNHKHSVAVDGGNDNIRYGITFSYDNQHGVMKDDYRNRLNAGVRIDYRMDDFLIINRVQYDKVDSKDSPYGSFSTFVNQLPYNEMKDAFGRYVKQFPVWHSGSQYVNPMYEGAQTKSYNTGGSEQFQNNLQVDWSILPVLQFKFLLGLTKQTNQRRNFTDPDSGIYALNSTIRGALSTTDGDQHSWLTRLQLLYNQAIEKHYLNFSFVAEARETKSKSIRAEYEGFPSGSLSSIMFAQRIVEKPTETDNHTRNAGALLTANYSYDNIYLLDASVRFDGSSEFGSEKKYAPFWSAGVGVNLHKYAFLGSSSVLDLLKLTATFGQTGKVDFAPYAAKDIYAIFPTSWYASGMGVKLMALGNPELAWEVKDSYTYSTEFELKDKLVYGKLSYYHEITKNQITDIAIPSSFGFPAYKDNMGKIKNTGIELSLSSHLIRKKDLFLSINGHIRHNKNTILEISNSLKRYNDRVDEYYDGYGYSSYTAMDPKWAKPFRKYEEGSSTTSIYAMKSLGIDPASGKEVFVRRDGSITYEWESGEQQVVGDTEPDVFGKFHLNFQWKSLNIFTSFIYAFGGQVYNSTYANRIENVDLLNYNADRRVLSDRWIQIGDITPLKDIADRSQATRPTSRFVQNENYLDFNSLSVAWIFQDAWVKRWNLNQVKLQFNMNDVAHLSTIKRERGTDYPFARTFDLLLGIYF
ncbi:MAG: SusC/RagA family TonB-linked outer membrane protein [Odoribacteraceae bacterium]|nr:SusC/RagA family TonB-linked outer membrane protein [Odoribacteraceae bacterium]